MDSSQANPNLLWGYTQYTEVKEDDWKQCWEAGKTTFHIEGPNPGLEKHLGSMIQGRKQIRIFLPFCGKAVDMKWLYDQGHSIVGIDCVVQALEEFFTENALDYVVEDVNPSLTLYKSKDGRIQLFCGDFFKLTASLVGPIDGIWDRGAFGSCRKSDRKRYADLIVTFMSRGTRYLMETFYYNEEQYVGPPYSVQKEGVESMYGHACDVTLLDVMPSQRYRKRFKVKDAGHNIFQLTLK